MRPALLAGCALGALLWGEGLRAQEIDLAPDALEGRPIALDAAVIRRRADGVLVAEGGVRAFAAGRALRAETITYDAARGVVTASGGVVIEEADGSLTYAEKIVLSDDLRDGLAIGFAAMLADDTRLTAAYAERLGGSRNELAYATFSPCPVCLEGDEAADAGPTPFWRIRARKAIQKRDDGVILYRDVFFDVLGVPIFYSPILSHPDPSVERQSGFLTPTPGRSSELGAFVEVPYHFALSDNYDLTFSPTPTTDAGVLLKARWRHRLFSGSYDLSGSFVHFDTPDPQPGDTGFALFETPPDNRWHIFGDGKFDITDTWSWGFDVERTSDDTFVRIYNIDPVTQRRGRPVFGLGNRLQSDVYVEGRSRDFYALGESVFFQGLRVLDDEETTPAVLPRFRVRRAFGAPLIGGRVDILGDFVSLRRATTDAEEFDTVEDVTRATLQGDWSRVFTFGPGLRFKPFAQGRTDVYSLENEDGDLDVVVRGLPTGGAELSWPFARVGASGRQIVEPIVLFAASIAEGNPDEIPGAGSDVSDSVITEFDETNLIRINRSPGFDVFENGVRLVTALRSDMRWDNGFSAEAVVGRLFRFTGASPFSANSGLGDDRSDFVGRVSFDWRSRVTLRARARFDPANFNIRRTDANLGLNFSDYALNAQYVLAAGDAVEGGVEPSEEIYFQARAKIYGGFSLFGDTRRDVQGGDNIQSGGGFIYENDCVRFSLSVRRDSTQDRDDVPDTTVLFTLSLKSLGEFVTQNRRGF